ncbi:nitroreductase family protein [Dehalococcoidia bacterium]|nr:nitroreductase family protein [Dehalococcoidia bacterium]
MTELSLFQAIHSQRATRRFAKTPVSQESIATIMQAAIRAPNGGNRQPWYFLVIRDRETKRRIGEWYLAAWNEIYGDIDPETIRQASRSGGVLGRGMADIPVLILACIDHSDERAETPSIVSGASIYPAVQNLMLAARALGLGTVLTTIHRRYEQDIKKFLEIPDNIETAALIPVGYPASGEHFGGSVRKNIEEVTFGDRWAQ